MQKEMPMKIERVCIVCDKGLVSAFGGNQQNEDEWNNPPDEATVWTTTGNYGSALYDPITNTDEFLQCFICDTCLAKKRNLVQKVSRVRPVRQELYFEAWDKPEWDKEEET